MPRRQTRALLYYLATRLEPVARARLTFLFWPDIPDAIARRQLTRLVSSLRAVLPHPALLVVDEETIALNPALAQSDSQQLALAGAANEPLTLQTAADLYRGPFLAGFALPNAPEYEAWQTQTARQMEMYYLVLLERLVMHYTRLADYPAAIRCTQQYLAADDLAETMHARLIGLYALVGDRAAALRQYERCAQVLERELGVSPLPATRMALETAPQPQEPRFLPVQPSLELPLTGRESAMAQLHAVAQHGRRGSLVLIHGAPGMGKTRLLREFALQHRSRSLILAGSSYPGSHTLPYHPLLHALHTTFNRHDLWSAVPAAWLSEMLPLLPDLRRLFPDLPPALPAAPAQARARVFAALTQTLHAWALQTPLLLCLDDLQWADEGTLGWLQYLAGHWQDAPLLVLASTHNKSAPGLAPLRSTLFRVGRLVEVELNNLTASDVTRLLSHLPTPPPPALAQRIHEVSGGNPFFALEIVRELQERGQLTHWQDESDLPLPATLREAILARVGHVTPVARQVLEAAAVLDPELDDVLLQLTSARSLTETASALDELLAHQLLQLGDEPDQGHMLAFPHGLMQVIVYRDLTPWRRKLLHRRAGDALAHLQPHNAISLARHYSEATAWEAAVACYRQAAVQASQAGANHAALELVNQACDLLTHLPQPDAARLALLRQRLGLQRVLVRLDDWQADAQEVLRLAAAARDTAARLEAWEAQISLYVLQSEFARAEATAVEALALAEQTGNRLAEARIRLTLGWHLADAMGRSREGLAHLEEACRLARAAGADDVLYQALCNRAFVQRAEGRCVDAVASAQQALALTAYRPGGTPQPAFADALRELGEAKAYLGRWEEARWLLRPLLDLYQTLDDPWNYGAVLHNYGLYSASIGQHADAIGAMRQLVALSESVGLPADSDYGVWHRAGLARVLLAAGDTPAAGRLLASLDTSKLAPGRPYLAWVRAAVAHELVLGHTAAALAIVEPAVNWWWQSRSLHDVDVLLLLAEVALAAGDRTRAEAAVREATTRLEASDMRRYHLRLHAARYAVTGDSAALDAFHAELADQAAGFSDPALRVSFVRWEERRIGQPRRGI